MLQELGHAHAAGKKVLHESSLEELQLSQFFAMRAYLRISCLHD